MNYFQPISDKAAIGFSLLCALHCFALPVSVVLFPSLASLPLDNEAFHRWMLAVVIPASAYALTLGCKQHKRHRIFVLGFAGISSMLAAVIVGETYGELWEKGLTVVGAGMITCAHYRNYQLCQNPGDCSCHE